MIGHEMDLWEFLSLNPSPDQVDRVLKSPLQFVKISLQRMKDGNWAVSHPDSVVMVTPDGDSKWFQFSDLTWDQVQKYKAHGNKIDVYRLEDYINRDHSHLCWMLSPKESPDDFLVQKLVQLGAQDRTVILTYGLADVQFLETYPASLKLHYAGRVRDNPTDIQSYGPYISNLWGIEVDPTSSTPTMVKDVQKAGFKAYVDSMTYDKTYELFATACQKVFAMGVDYTQTNRALQCIDEMGFKPSAETDRH